MKENNIINIKDVMTKREQKFFWLLMDTCKKVSAASDAISSVLYAEEIGLLEDILPFDEIAELLNRAKNDESLENLMIEYWEGRIDQEGFMKELSFIPYRANHYK